MSGNVAEAWAEMATRFWSLVDDSRAVGSSPSPVPAYVSSYDKDTSGSQHGFVGVGRAGDHVCIKRDGVYKVYHMYIAPDDKPDYEGGWSTGIRFGPYWLDLNGPKHVYPGHGPHGLRGWIRPALLLHTFTKDPPVPPAPPAPKPCPSCVPPRRGTYAPPSDLLNTL